MPFWRGLSEREGERTAGCNHIHRARSLYVGPWRVWSLKEKKGKEGRKEVGGSVMC